MSSFFVNFLKFFFPQRQTPFSGRASGGRNRTLFTDEFDLSGGRCPASFCLYGSHAQCLGPAMPAGRAPGAHLLLVGGSVGLWDCGLAGRRASGSMMPEHACPTAGGSPKPQRVTCSGAILLLFRIRQQWHYEQLHMIPALPRLLQLGQFRALFRRLRNCSNQQDGLVLLNKI